MRRVQNMLDQLDVIMEAPQVEPPEPPGQVNTQPVDPCSSDSRNSLVPLFVMSANLSHYSFNVLSFLLFVFTVSSL